ncbi:hypothetical protein [Chryseobacterium arthrosphaerae]|uniref:hypothetical protein n=1 Tax=Chryseobacterium arthrosphaerae TaxID=651561 RepID=UPI001F4B7C39|nr:hypothetical protein [Chryseobacterium arthrosphaerae]
MKHINSLKQKTHEKLETTVEDIELTNQLIRRYETINSKLKEMDVSFDYLIPLINILKYRLFIGFLLSDICSTLNVYNNAKTLYEEKFAIRTFFIIISEGFKKIYNFTKINNKGDIKLTYRNNSFWVKEIKPIIYEDLVELKTEYNGITDSLDAFLQFDFQTIKTNRDLAVHYDKNPLLVYDLMVKLDLEQEVDLVLKFMDIINKMLAFTELLTLKFSDKVDTLSKELQIKKQQQIDEIMNILNIG